MTEQSPFTATAFVPTEQQVADLLAWYAEYDAHAAKGDVEAMADMALFPQVVMTNDSAGECVAQEWDRATFVQAMGMATGDGTPPGLQNHRDPVFLGPDLAVVVTNTTMTLDGQTQHMRYVDIMAKAGGKWRFKSMVQAGWGDMMREYLGA
jgi:ketosteroid isomerase-like protein